MGEGYDIKKEAIIDWAVQYASFEELEEVAKALYGIYAQRRQQDYPEKHKDAKKYKAHFKKK